MTFDAHLLAVGLDPAAGTKRADGPADVLTPRDEQIVELYPIFSGELISQRYLGLIRGFRMNVPEPVGDPVHVGVHTHAVLAESQGDYQIGCFPPDTFELEELFQVVGDLSAMLVDEVPADAPEGPGLGFVESHGEDQFGDLLLGERQDLGRSLGPFEQSRRGHPRDLIFRS